MKNDTVTGICIGAAVCAVGIVYMPHMSPDPLAAAIVCGGLGGLGILTALQRHSPPAVGSGMAAIAILGAYALLTGIVTGAAALGIGLLAGVALLTLAVRVLQDRSPAAPRKVGEPA